METRRLLWHQNVTVVTSLKIRAIRADWFPQGHSHLDKQAQASVYGSVITLALLITLPSFRWVLGDPFQFMMKRGHPHDATCHFFTSACSITTYRALSETQAFLRLVLWLDFYTVWQVIHIY